MKEKYKKAKRKSNYYWSYSHLFAYMNSFWYKPLNLQWGGGCEPETFCLGSPVLHCTVCFVIFFLEKFGDNYASNVM